jgi:bis(5'-nucleosidyl)-tetraphosphatase
VNPELGRPEHHAYRWVSLEEARGLVADRLQPILDFVEETLGREK